MKILQVQQDREDVVTFYVYIYRDPSRNDEPIYVGKGHGKRALSHLKRKDRHPFVQRLQKLAENSVVPTVEIIDAIDEDHAYFLEECLVQIIGRKNIGTGPLLNLSDGGRGISKGTVRTAETRSKISQAQIGKTLSPEHRANIGRGLLGKPQSQQKSERISSSKKGVKNSAEHNANLSAALRGKPWTAARRAAQEAKKK